MKQTEILLFVVCSLQVMRFKYDSCCLAHVNGVQRQKTAKRKKNCPTDDWTFFCTFITQMPNCRQKARTWPLAYSTWTMRRRTYALTSQWWRELLKRLRPRSTKPRAARSTRLVCSDPLCATRMWCWFCLQAFDLSSCWFRSCAIANLPSS